MTVLPRESVRFRTFLIDKLWTEGAFGYITQDVFLGICPICGRAVTVKFAGFAPRATLHCHGECTEEEIGDRLGLKVRK
jgi:hypothetical protein